MYISAYQQCFTLTTNYTVATNIDSPGSDIGHYPGNTVDQLKAICNRNPTCLGFNSNGNRFSSCILWNEALFYYEIGT